MTDAYRKLSPGDVLKSFPSSSWNDLLDMARDWKATRNAITSKTAGLGLESARTLVPIKNATGSDVDRYGVLALSDFLISPSAHLQNFKNRPAFEGDTPAATMAEKFVVLQEPIGSGKIGLGLLAGVTAVQIDVTQAHHCFADTVPGDATKLRSCLWGPVEILVKESGTGTKWAYVSLGNFRRAFRARGVTTEAIDQNTTGDVLVFKRTSSTGFTSTGESVEALNDLDYDVGDNSTVEVIFDGLGDDGTPYWRFIEPDYTCPEE